MRALSESERLALYGISIRITFIVLSFISISLVARLLGPEEFGRFAFWQSCVLLLVGFTLGGSQSLLVILVPQYAKSNQLDFSRGLLHHLKCINLIIACVSVVIALACVLLDAFTSSTSMIACLVLTTFFMSQSMLNEAATRGLGHVVVGQTAELVMRPICMILFVGALWYQFGSDVEAESAVYVFTFSVVVSYLWSVFVLNRKIDLGGGKLEDKTNWNQRLINFSYTVWVETIQLQMVVLLLGFFSVNEQVAEYRLALQLTLLSTFGVKTAVSVFTPQLSVAYWEGNTKKVEQLLRTSCLTAVAVSTPITCIYLAIPLEVIGIAYGDSYESVACPLLILALSQFVVALCGPINSMFLITSNEKLYKNYQIINVLLSAVLLVPMITYHGAVGAAFVVGFSNICFKLFLVYKLHKIVGVLCMPKMYRIVKV